MWKPFTPARNPGSGPWRTLNRWQHKVNWNPSLIRSNYVLTPAQLDAVEEMSVFHCTEEEIAHAIGICREAFEQVKKRNEEVLKRIALGRSKGKRALRSVQFKVALSGNVNMLMYLGKVVLGQVPDAQVHIGGSSSVGDGPTLTDLSPAAKTHLADLAQAITRAALAANTTDVEATVVDDGNGNGSGNGDDKNNKRGEEQNVESGNGGQ